MCGDEMTLPKTIAIDGPAASGKSTLAEALAKDLGYLYFDTGVMYRAVTLVALLRGVDVGDEGGCVRLAEEICIDVYSPSKDDGRMYDVMIDGCDQTWEIREPSVDANVSVVSAYLGVRQALTEQQRRIGLRGNVVMVGRDIGTVVLPEAEMKIYLDASVEERARRRFDECKARGEDHSFENILDALRIRDQIDSTRDIAPLRAAGDAIVLNSDALNAADVLAKIKSLLETTDG
jgi:cytidylate kinase